MKDDEKLPNAYTLGNYKIADEYKRLAELQPKAFLATLRYFDGQIPFKLEPFMPYINVPQWSFRWRVKIDTGRMAKVGEPNSKTEFHTTDWKYEDFYCKEIKDGFYVTSFDLATNKLPGSVVARLTEEMTNAIKMRETYIGLQAMMGNSWNNQSTHRLVEGWALKWNDSSSTPIADILKAKRMVTKMCGQVPSLMILDLDTYDYLNQHSSIVQQIQYTDKSLLTNGQIETIKNLKIIVIENFYKEDSSESSMLGAPGRGDLAESKFDETIPGPDNKTFFLQDTAIITTPKVGYMGRFGGVRGNNWVDKDTDILYYNSWEDICPIIEDYGRICVLHFLDSSDFSNGKEQVTGKEYPKW